MKILIIEDDKGIIAIIREILPEHEIIELPQSSEKPELIDSLDKLCRGNLFDFA